MQLPFADLVFVTFLLGSTTAARNTTPELHEQRNAESSLWIRGDPVPQDYVLPMRIGMVQENAARGHEWLMEVSDPTSEKYSQWHTAEAVRDAFAPSTDTVEAIRDWIESAAGIANVSQSTNRQWVQFDASVGKIQALLSTQYHLYQNSETGSMAVGCERYHIPSYLRPYVDFITPGVTHLGVKTKAPAAKESGRTALSKRMGASTSHGRVPGVFPQDLKNLYHIPKGNTSYHGNELGLYEMGKSAYVSQELLNIFYTKLFPTIPNGTFPTVHFIDGDNQTKDQSVETALDCQVAYPLVWPQNLAIFIDPHTVPEAPQDSFLNFFTNTFLDAIDGSYCSATGLNPGEKNTSMLQCGVFKPTNVISFSYVHPELITEKGEKYQARQCLEFLKLGMQGISLLIASGDNGATSVGRCLEPDNSRLWPTYFGTCPYVTTVGATRLVPDSKSPSKYHEVAANIPQDNYTSGGGFSNQFPRPSYQNDAVEAFFKSKAAPTFPYYTNATIGDGIYNRSGRGYPDVSALGQHIEQSDYTYEGPGGAGTSAATPIFASVLTRINEERLRAGKKTVGFVNPVLYANPKVLNDIMSGTNQGCKPSSVAFSAGPGWDPVTGLGTPNYPAMLKLFMGLQ